jgi:hypothetical protein
MSDTLIDDIVTLDIPYIQLVQYCLIPLTLGLQGKGKGSPDPYSRVVLGISTHCASTPSISLSLSIKVKGLNDTACPLRYS